MKIDKKISRRQLLTVAVGAIYVAAYTATILKTCSNQNSNYYPSHDNTLNSLKDFSVIKYVGKNGNINCLLIGGSSSNFCYKIDLENECLKRETEIGPYWSDVEDTFDIIEYDTLPRVLTRKYDYKESYTIEEIKDAVEDYKLEEVKTNQKK